MYPLTEAQMRSARQRKLPKAWLDVSKGCVALGHAPRQRILLLFEPGERIAMQQILETTTLSRTAVAHHLRVMRDAGVLVSEREGKEAFYWIDKDYVRAKLAAVIDYIDSDL